MTVERKHVPQIQLSHQVDPNWAIMEWRWGFPASSGRSPTYFPSSFNLHPKNGPQLFLVQEPPPSESITDPRKWMWFVCLSICIPVPSFAESTLICSCLILENETCLLTHMFFLFFFFFVFFFSFLLHGFPVCLLLMPPYILPCKYHQLIYQLFLLFYSLYFTITTTLWGREGRGWSSIKGGYFLKNRNMGWFWSQEVSAQPQETENSRKPYIMVYCGPHSSTHFWFTV